MKRLPVVLTVCSLAVLLTFILFYLMRWDEPKLQVLQGLKPVQTTQEKGEIFITPSSSVPCDKTIRIFEVPLPPEQVISACEQDLAIKGGKSKSRTRASFGLQRLSVTVGPLDGHEGWSILLLATDKPASPFDRIKVNLMSR